MTLTEKITEMLREANAEYGIEYEEKSFMNIKADKITRERSWVLINEIVQGKYIKLKGRRKRVTQLTLYFFKFIDMHSQAGRGDTLHSQHTASAIRRQEQRDQIEAEIVFPFLDAFEAAWRKNMWQNATSDYEIGFVYPLPYFDANENGIELTLTLEEEIC